MADFSLGSLLLSGMFQLLISGMKNAFVLHFFPMFNYFFYFSHNSQGNEMLLCVTVDQFIMKQVFQNTLDFDIFFSPPENGMLKCY